MISSTNNELGKLSQAHVGSVRVIEAEPFCKPDITIEDYADFLNLEDNIAEYLSGFTRMDGAYVKVDKRVLVVDYTKAHNVVIDDVWGGETGWVIHAGFQLYVTHHIDSLRTEDRMVRLVRDARLSAALSVVAQRDLHAFSVEVV